MARRLHDGVKGRRSYTDCLCGRVPVLWAEACNWKFAVNAGNGRAINNVVERCGNLASDCSTDVTNTFPGSGVLPRVRTVFNRGQIVQSPATKQRVSSVKALAHMAQNKNTTAT